MRVAVLGYGTVGKAVYDLLGRSEALTPAGVFVRPGKAALPFQTDDLYGLLARADGVVEVLGGVEPAFSFARQALSRGKHLVTANKALVAAHGLELAALAREKGVGFRFSAACGGALPFLRHAALVRESEGGVTRLGGILNGTANYILSAMQEDGEDFASALARAQSLGYAEADPTDDLTGTDTARKLALACAVGFDLLPRSLPLREGIRSFSRECAADLQRRGLTCRLYGKAGKTEAGAYAFAEPSLFYDSAPESRVTGSGNLVWTEGSASGRIAFAGAGAGGAPTASNVVRDLLEIGAGCGEMLSPACGKADLTGGGPARRYYLRGPEGLLPSLEDAAREGGTVSGWLGQAIAPEEMHALAARWRQKGAEVFFAGLEENP